MKKRKILIAVFLAVGFLMSAVTAYAGSINGPEAGLIARASGTFYYKGQAYVATAESMGRLKAYLSRDDIDLTQEKADEAASMMYSNVKNGVIEGYIVPVGGTSGSSEESTGNSILNKAEKKSQEKAGSAAVKVADKDSSFAVIKKNGTAVFSGQLPVKNTGADLTGMLWFAAALLLLTFACVLAAWKRGLFARKEDRS